VFRGEYNNITLMVFGELVDTFEETRIQKLFDELSLPEVNHATNAPTCPMSIEPIDEILGKYL
jgi:hypothetical protein